MAVDPRTLAEAEALIVAQSAARRELAALTQAAVRAEVSAFTGWWSSAEITKFAGRLAKLTRAGQRQTATSTDAFAVRILRVLTGRRPSTAPIRVDDLRGVPLESVYGRLADQYRWLHATRGPGAPDALLERPEGPPRIRLTGLDVLERVSTRADVQVDDNLGLAFRDQWAADLDEAPPEVTGYRRIIHPELVATGSTAPGPVCGLCVAASGLVYKREELLPIHERCRCSVAPILGEPGGDGDPGWVISQEDLALVYKAAGGSTAGDNLKATKFLVEEHSELGPRLVFAGQKFRTAEQARAAEDRQRRRRSAQRSA